jgi:hypothetical protein
MLRLVSTLALVVAVSRNAIAAPWNVDLQASSGVPARTLRSLGMAPKLGDPAVDDMQIRLMQELGVSIVRWAPAGWHDIEKPKGVFRLSPGARRALDLMIAAHLQIIVLLLGPNELYQNPLDPQAFARYAAWMAATLKGAPIIAYEIWNEPSNFSFRQIYGGAWNGRGNAKWVQKFAEMVQTAVRAIRQVDPDATIIDNLDGPAWIYAMKEYPGDFGGVDGVSLHPYTFHLPAETVPWGGLTVDLRDGVSVADSEGSLLSYLHIQTVDDPKLYLGRKLEPWVTEIGFPTCNPTSPQKMYACVSPDAQAAYHARALISALSYGVNSWCIYELLDEGNDPNDPEKNFGLVRDKSHGYSPKPAFFAIERISTLLGKRWRNMKTPGDLKLYVGRSGSKRLIRLPARDDYERTTAGPQNVWFETPSGYVSFLWNAGSYQNKPDTNWPEARMAWTHVLGGVTWVRASDLVTGKTFNLAVDQRDGTLSIDHLPLSSRPLAIEVGTSALN